MPPEAAEQVLPSTTKPTFNPRLPFTDPEFASQAAYKARESRQSAKARLEVLTKLHFDTLPKDGPEPKQEPIPASTALHAVKDQLRLVLEERVRVERDLQTDLKPFDRCSLNRALTGLLEQERKLLGIPDPAPLRTKARTGREVRPPVEPV